MDRVLVITGGRKYNNARFLRNKIADWHPDMIVHGGATGADLLAHQYAREQGIPVACFWLSNNQWRTHGNYAGIRRNEQMIQFLRMIADFSAEEIGVESITTTYDYESGHPLIQGIAFPGGSGTNDMSQRMLREGIVFWDYRDDPEAQMLPL
jgi:hypothetical protein